MPYASLACDMTSASEVAVAAWGALQVLYAFAFAFTHYSSNNAHFIPITAVYITMYSPQLTQAIFSVTAKMLPSDSADRTMT